MKRSRFLKLLGGGLVSPSLWGQPEHPKPETVVYKAGQGCEIHADVYPAGGGRYKPALMWIHGGALINGSRWLAARGPMFPFQLNLLKAGCAIISIEYRLAPETKLPGITEDVQDAYRWIRTECGKRYGIDPDRIATGGDSAGGYLTLMTGICVNPRPRALVSYYGYGDIDGPWCSEPDDYYRKQPLVTKEEAWASVGKTPVANPMSGQRNRFYLYCRQQGRWPVEVTGHDPHKEPRWFDRYCPVRNVTKTYPPALLIHGTEDRDVPYAESKAMSVKLAELGVDHELVTVAGAGHVLAGASQGEIDHANARALEWVKSHCA